MIKLTAMLHPEDSNDNFVFYLSDFDIDITLDRSLSVSDNFNISLYNDQLMLLDYSDSSLDLRHKGKKMTVSFFRQSIWIPGNYFVLLRDNTKDVILRFDIVLDNKGKCTVSEARQCGPLSDEDILSGPIYEKKSKWRFYSAVPGMIQLRRLIVERQKIWMLNKIRGKHDLKPLSVSGNMLLAVRSPLGLSPCMELLDDTTEENKEVCPKDCRDFYNKALENPYENLGTCFMPVSTGHYGYHHTFIFKNIGVLTDNGGKHIVNYMLRYWPYGSSIVFIGSQDELDTLMNENPSLAAFFPKENRIKEMPFSKEEMLIDFYYRVRLNHLALSRDGAFGAYNLLSTAYDKGQTASWTRTDLWHYVELCLTPIHACNSIKSYASCGIKDNCLVKREDIGQSLKAYLDKSSDDSLAELDGMIGLSEIKQRITTFSNRLRFYNERRQLGLPTNDGTTYHAVFTGNPGTGKTTVARMLGKIYHSLGILSKGDVISVDRTRIVGRYIGETEENMAQLLKEARGNILFIDEAYTLYNKDDERDFGRHAIETLLTVLSRKNPDMVIIFAGYEKEMDELLKMNPGLAGRFPYKLHFPDYSTSELMQIGESLLAKEQYELTPEAARVMKETIRETVAHRSPTFSNARWIDQYIHNGIIPALADRLMTLPHVYDRTAYQRIEAEDVRTAYSKFNPRATELRPRRVIGFNA